MNPLKKKPRTVQISPIPPKPDWMKVRLPFPDEENPVAIVRKTVSKPAIHTVCESASCPNLNHCWSRKTATYMIGGDICTRRCKYCDVAFGKPLTLDPDEPRQVAESCEELGLQYVVITAVNRDDLPDGGAEHFVRTISEIRSRLPQCRIEVLVPDFKGDPNSLQKVLDAKPDIFSYNIETVERLFPILTPSKNYSRSLYVLKYASSRGFRTKSGIILGLGETREEVYESLQDLKSVGVTMLTLGQYLQPTPTHYPVARYLHPDEFREWAKIAQSMGFVSVASGPLVRSSYHADEQVDFNGLV